MVVALSKLGTWTFPNPVAFRCTDADVLQGGSNESSPGTSTVSAFLGLPARKMCKNLNLVSKDQLILTPASIDTCAMKMQ